jgi:hypothetical protein
VSSSILHVVHGVGPYPHVVADTSMEKACRSRSSPYGWRWILYRTTGIGLASEPWRWRTISSIFPHCLSRFTALLSCFLSIPLLRFSPVVYLLLSLLFRSHIGSGLLLLRLADASTRDGEVTRPVKVTGSRWGSCHQRGGAAACRIHSGLVVANFCRSISHIIFRSLQIEAKRVTSDSAASSHEWLIDPETEEDPPTAVPIHGRLITAVRCYSWPLERPQSSIRSISSQILHR